MFSALGTLTGYTVFEPLVVASASTELASLSLSSPATGVLFFDAAVSAFAAIELDLFFQPSGISAASLGGKVSILSGWKQHFTVITGTGGMGVYSMLTPSVLATWAVNRQLGWQVASVPAYAATWVWVLESCDVFLLIAELAIVCMLLGGFSFVLQRTGFRTHGYHDIVTLCQQRGVSMAEVFSLVSFMFGFILFDAFVTMAEDDALEAISYIFAAVVLLAVVLLGIAVDVQYYFLISSISGGEQTLRLLYTDTVNNVLCLLRIFFCWIRYLFYDLQAELVDFSFHYTELADEAVVGVGACTGDTVMGSMTLGWTGLAAFTGMALVGLWDAASLLLQLLIGAFKLALALFLFWLILDLFLLRTLARSEARWAAIRGVK